MNLDKLSPLPIKRFQFTMRSLRLTPQKSGAYALISPDSRVLYVGKASDLRNRLNCHLQDTRKTAVFEDTSAFWFYYLETNNEYEAMKIEHGWLNSSVLEDGSIPPFNAIHT